MAGRKPLTPEQKLLSRKRILEKKRMKYIEDKKKLNPNYIPLPEKKLSEEWALTRYERVKKQKEKYYKEHPEKRPIPRPRKSWKEGLTEEQIDAVQKEKRRHYSAKAYIKYKEYFKAYYVEYCSLPENQERARKKTIEFMEKHKDDPEVKERIKKAGKKYYEANKERIKKVHDEWYKENREEILKQSRIRYRENKEKILSYHKKWYRKNKKRLKDLRDKNKKGE